VFVAPYPYWYRYGWEPEETSLGSVLMAGLRDIQRRYPVLGDVRGLGLLVGTEFTHLNGVPATGVTKAVLAECQANKLLLLSSGTYSNTIRWIPPLIVTQAQIETAPVVLECVLEAVA
jgi:4-aminobutyrate aminotransferase